MHSQMHNGVGGNFDPTQSSLKVDAAEFVPRARTTPHSELSPHVQHFSHGTPQDRITAAIELMTRHPAIYDEVIEPLTTSLIRCISSARHLQDIVEVIFKQSVSDNQFRYTGARLCNHFSHHLKLHIESGETAFRTTLLRRCQEEHKRRFELLADIGTRLQLIGYTLFMGELLLNVTLNNGRSLLFLREPIREMLNLLLDHPQETACLKCAQQLLKMTGSFLESSEKEESEDGKTEKLDEIFDKIKAILEGKDLDRRTRNMLSCVVTLRDSDWGRKKEQSNGREGPGQALAYVGEDGTFFYTQPGDPIPSGATPAHLAVTPQDPATPLSAALGQQEQPSDADGDAAPDDSAAAPPSDSLAGQLSGLSLQQPPPSSAQQPYYSGNQQQNGYFPPSQTGYRAPGYQQQSGVSAQQAAYNQQILMNNARDYPGIISAPNYPPPTSGAYQDDPYQQYFMGGAWGDELLPPDELPPGFYEEFMGAEGDALYPGEYMPDEEFTDEIQAAFEEFMQANQQQGGHHQPPYGHH